MAGKITEAVKAFCVCPEGMAVLTTVLFGGYLVLDIILYFVPIVLAFAVCFAVLYGIGYIIYALLTGR